MAPKHFERLIKEFFVNLRSIYAEGRRSVDMPHEFWPWFAATLHTALSVHTLNAQGDASDH